MTLENVERRILGAMRFVDAISGLPVARPITLVGDGLHLIRNQHGDYVILDAPGLSGHIRAFESPPAVPALKSVKVPLKISDPSGGFLPRKFTLELPRDPDPKNANSIFDPIIIPLFLSPISRPEISWAVLRATVRHETSRDRLPWSLIQILKDSDNNLLASGVADSRGEALLVVAGILFAMPAEGGPSTLTKKIEVRLQAFFDKDKLTRIKEADLVSAQPDPNLGYLPDLDTLQKLPPRTVKLLERGASGATATIKIAAGQTLVTDLLVKLQ